MTDPRSANVLHRRRHWRAIGAASMLAIAFGMAMPFLQPVHGQEAPALHRAALSISPLGNNAYAVTGGVTNTGFVIGKDGVVVVDAQMLAEDAVAMQQAIRTRTDLPVRAIILTHSDPDHIDGLPAWPRDMLVVAQENVLTEMKEVLAGKVHYARPQPPVPPGLGNYLPTELVRHSKTVTLAGIKVVLTHLAAGHTDGDLVVFFPAQRVAFVGDLLTIGDPNIPDSGLYPVINLEKYGSSAGWLRVMKAALALDADTYIGGHGRAQIGRAELRAAIAATEQRRRDVVRLFLQGKQLQEIKAILKDPRPGPPLFFPTFVEIVYQELLRG